MEQLRAELSHLLGEKLSRVECVNEKADTALWSLYDSQGNPMPLMARSFTSPGVARQLAWKMSMLAREGTVRMPTVYGVMTHEEHPGPDVLLIERLRGVSVEAPTRTPERWEQLKDQIVEALLAWHRQDSRGLVGAVDSTQENLWPLWYRQRVEVLWGTLNQFNNTGLTMQDKRILFRTRECLPTLFEGFNDNCVLVHGNFTLRSMLKDSRSDQPAGDGRAGDHALGAARVRTVQAERGRGGGRFALALSSARPRCGGLSLATLALSSLG